jgi:transcriptional regulator with XRE-family HTH domain
MIDKMTDGGIGERLKRARKAAGFKSGADVAERLGMSPSTYLSHENGQTTNIKQAQLRAAVPHHCG